MSTRYIVDAEGRPVEAIVDIEELRVVLEAQATLSKTLTMLEEAVRNAALQNTLESRRFAEESARDLDIARGGLEDARRKLRDLGLPEDLEDLDAIRAFDADTEMLERGDEETVPLRDALPRIEAERAELEPRGEL